jgi:hypothetical protein
MGFATKGWRRIVVGDVLFYWTARSRDAWAAVAEATPNGAPTPPTLSYVAIRPECEPYRLLDVHCGYGARSIASQHITPGLVRCWIETARGYGWPGARASLRLDGVDDAGGLSAGVPQPDVSDNPAWLTPTVVGIARGVFRDQAFDRLPILADALEDAGCADERLLGRCRGNDPRIHGWWVIGLLLGASAVEAEPAAAPDPAGG